MAPSIPLIVVLSAAFVACAADPKPKPTAPKTEARSTSELVQAGRMAAGRGDSVRAEQYLSLALEEGADERVVMPVLLESCLKSSHLRAALNHAEPYLLEHPEDERLRYLVANIHLGLGQVVMAKRELGLLLQRNQQKSDAHYLLGIIESSSRVDSARRHFTAALEYTLDDEQRVEVESRLDELLLRDQQRSELPQRTETTVEGAR